MQRPDWIVSPISTGEAAAGGEPGIMVTIRPRAAGGAKVVGRSMLSPVSGSEAVLDDPVGVSLAGQHAHLARRHGRVSAYLPDVASFCSLPLNPQQEDWADAATLLGPGGLVDLFTAQARPPAGWDPVFDLAGVQMIGPDKPSSFHDDQERIVALGGENIADMLELVELAKPGPFWPRTIAMGPYWGIYENGRLVAMAGRRFAASRWSEVSAVCTHPQWRGRGYALALIRGMLAELSNTGSRAFLHLIADNVAARRLYEQLGFQQRCDVRFQGFRVPDRATASRALTE